MNLQEVKNTFQLTSLEFQQLEKCVSVYSKCFFSVDLSNLFVRIWDAVCPLFLCKSNWQKTTEILHGRVKQDILGQYTSDTSGPDVEKKVHDTSDFILRYLVTKESCRQHHPQYLISKETWINENMESLVLKQVIEKEALAKFPNLKALRGKKNEEEIKEGLIKEIKDFHDRALLTVQAIKKTLIENGLYKIELTGNDHSFINSLVNNSNDATDDMAITIVQDIEQFSKIASLTILFFESWSNVVKDKENLKKLPLEQLQTEIALMANLDFEALQEQLNDCLHKRTTRGDSQQQDEKNASVQKEGNSAREFQPFVEAPD